MEALENFKDLSKPWKRNTEADIEHVKGEVIDQLFFVLQSCVALGMDSAEVFERYNQNIQKISNALLTSAKEWIHHYELVRIV